MSAAELYGKVIIRMFRLLRMSFLLLLVVSLSACYLSDRTKELKGADLWNHEHRLPPEYWEHAVEQKMDDVRIFMLPVPFQFGMRALGAERFGYDIKIGDEVEESKQPPSGTTKAIKFAWNDLGIPFLFMLPVRIEYCEAAYEPNAALPVSHQKLHLNPFHAGTKVEGEPTGWKAKAKGIPLFYSSSEISVDHNSTNVKLTNVLWSLGPFGLQDDSLRVGESKQLRSKGYYFVPVLAGGVFGTMLWSDRELREIDGIAQTNKTEGFHGALYGLLGYTHETVRPIEGARASQLQTQNHRLLFGILWADKAKKGQDGTKEYASNGPLWGMFGWGRRDGNFKIRFLWIPIG